MSVLIRNALAINTGLAGEAMRWDVATLGGDIRVDGPPHHRHGPLAATAG
jgi:hypothetical protein